jgi:hypothetical protein
MIIISGEAWKMVSKQQWLQSQGSAMLAIAFGIAAAIRLLVLCKCPLDGQDV